MVYSYKMGLLSTLYKTKRSSKDSAARTTNESYKRNTRGFTSKLFILAFATNREATWVLQAGTAPQSPPGAYR